MANNEDPYLKNPNNYHHYLSSPWVHDGKQETLVSRDLDQHEPRSPRVIYSSLPPQKGFQEALQELRKLLHWLLYPSLPSPKGFQEVLQELK